MKGKSLLPIFLALALSGSMVPLAYATDTTNAQEVNDAAYALAENELPDADAPADSEAPADPEAPAGSETPTDPETPADPEAPTDPEVSTDPETPANPEAPIGPDVNKPEQTPQNTPLAGAFPEAGVYTIAYAPEPQFKMQVDQASPLAGANVGWGVTDGSNAQKWYLSPQGNGVYVVRNVATGMALEVEQGQWTNGGNVTQQPLADRPSQLWVVTYEDGAYRLKSALGDIFLNAIGTNVEVSMGEAPCKVGLEITPVPDPIVQTPLAQGRLYEITAADNPLVALEVKDYARTPGAPVQMGATNGSRGQKWYALVDAEGYYTFECADSGLVLELADGNQLPGAAVRQAKPDGSRLQKWRVEQQADGSYMLYSAFSGLALDIAWGNLTPGTPVQLYTPLYNTAQRFYIYESAPVGNGYYNVAPCANSSVQVEVQDATWAWGANIQLYNTSESSAQKWNFVRLEDGSYRIESMLSGCVLTADAVAAGVNVVQMPFENKPEQRWDVYYIPGGYFAIMLSGTTIALDVQGGDAYAGVNMQTYDWNGGFAQCFSLSYTAPLADGDYFVGSLIDPNYKLDVQDNSINPGANVQTWEYNGKKSQYVRIKRQSDGYYKVTFPFSRCALDVAGASMDPGANVQQWNAWDSDAQLWSLQYAGNGCYRFVSKLNGLSLELANGENLMGSNVHMNVTADTPNQKFVFEQTKYDLTIDDLRIIWNSADPSHAITGFGGYESRIGNAATARLASTVNSIRNMGNQVGFLMMDLKTGQGVACNPDTIFYSASSVKGPYVCSLVHQKPWVLNSSWSGTINNILVYSSNEAYAALRNAFGPSTFGYWCDKSGVSRRILSSYYTWYSPRELGRLWLSNYETFTNGTVWGADLARRFGSAHGSLAQLALGGKYAMQSKGGWISGGPNATCDAAIIHTAYGDYLQVIMSDYPATWRNLLPLAYALENVYYDMQNEE